MQLILTNELPNTQPTHAYMTLINTRHVILMKGIDLILGNINALSTSEMNVLRGCLVSKMGWKLKT